MNKIYIDELLHDVYDKIENIIDYPVSYYKYIYRFLNHGGGSTHQ